MPKTRKKSTKKVTVGDRRIPTDAQLARLEAMRRVGKTLAGIAKEISEDDGKTCSRQLVDATVYDRQSWPNRRIRAGFAKAVGKTEEELGWLPAPEKEK